MGYAILSQRLVLIVYIANESRREIFGFLFVSEYVLTLNSFQEVASLLEILDFAYVNQF